MIRLIWEAMVYGIITLVMRMANDPFFYRYTEMDNSDFPIQIIHRIYSESGQLAKMHWHEHIQVYLFMEGSGVLYCNAEPARVSKGNVFIVNSNELHSLECMGYLEFYVVTLDFVFLFSHQVDSCQTKYIVPISQNRILFRNYIGNDEAVAGCLRDIVAEYRDRKPGYELAVKSSAYRMLVVLLRNYVEKAINMKENEIRIGNLKRFQKIFIFISENFQEDIRIAQLAEMVNVSESHLCRLFKQISGKTVGDYINGLRVEKAVELLKESDLNITEIAFLTGFSDANYFSRIFRKYKKITPSEMRKSS